MTTIVYQSGTIKGILPRTAVVTAQQNLDGGLWQFNEYSVTTKDMTAPTQFVSIWAEWTERTTMRYRTFLLTQLNARVKGTTAAITAPVLTEPNTAIYVSTDFNLSAGRFPTYEIKVTLEQV